MKEGQRKGQKLEVDMILWEVEKIVLDKRNIIFFLGENES